jgi:protease-4
MSMSADQIADRRRLRRKLSFWRVAAVVVLFVAIAAGIVAVGGRDRFPVTASAQIARVTITGFIATDRAQAKLIDTLAKTSAIKGVIVAIDSTGGATAGGEELYEGLRKLAAAKPTVATLGTVGASAAYMAAIGTDHIVARRTSITGSIGVIFEMPEVSGLMDKIGVNVEEIRSGPLKAEPSPFKPASEEAKAVVEGVIRDSFNWFVDIVAERRGLSRNAALALADGRIFTGRQALDAKLIDEIGGEDAAVAWLGTKGVNTSLPIKDWRPADQNVPWSFANAATVWIAHTLGISPELVRGSGLGRILPENLRLDGLLSVWQASLRGDQ